LWWSIRQMLYPVPKRNAFPELYGIAFRLRKWRYHDR
jgi:hypothetical protein